MAARHSFPGMHSRVGVTQRKPLAGRAAGGVGVTAVDLVRAGSSANGISRTRMARLVGVPTWALIELEPEGFGAPRDRRWNGVDDVYTLPGAWRMSGVLEAAGVNVEALKEALDELERRGKEWWQR